MEAVFAVIALLFVLFVALGVYATVKVVGAAKRSADRHIHQARRTVEEHTLRAKAFAQTGPAGEIAPSASPAPPTPCAGPPATAPAASRTTTSTR